MGSLPILVLGIIGWANQAGLLQPLADSLGEAASGILAQLGDWARNTLPQAITDSVTDSAVSGLLKRASERLGGVEEKRFRKALEAATKETFGSDRCTKDSFSDEKLTSFASFDANGIRSLLENNLRPNSEDQATSVSSKQVELWTKNLMKALARDDKLRSTFTVNAMDELMTMCQAISLKLDTVASSQKVVEDLVGQSDERPAIKLPPRAPGCTSFFSGRGNLTTTLAIDLAQEDHCVILHGMGGIGKTATALKAAKLAEHRINNKLAKELDEKQRAASYLISASESIESFLASLQPDTPIERGESSLGFTAEEARTQIERLIGQRGILIFDDVSTIEDLRLAMSFAGRVIITTRIDSGDFGTDTCSVYEIEPPSASECASIFCKYAKTEPENLSNQELDDIQALISIVERHTLAIELLAKLTRATGLTAREFRMALSGGDNLDLPDVHETVASGLAQQATYDERIEQLFNVDRVRNATGEDFGHLQALCMLSPKAVNRNDLKRWLGLDNLNPINNLARLGFMRLEERQRKDEQGSRKRDYLITMHDVVSTALRMKLAPQRGSLDTLVANMTEEIKRSPDYASTPALVPGATLARRICSSLQVAEIAPAEAMAIVELLNGNGNATPPLPYATAELARHAGKKLYQTGSFQAAMSTLGCATEIQRAIANAMEALDGSDPMAYRKATDLLNRALVDSLSDLGSALSTSSDVDSALAVFDKSIELSRASFGEDSVTTAQIAIKRCRALYRKDMFHECRNQLEAAINVFEGNDPEHPELGHAYNYLGLTMRALDNLDAAKLWLEKSLDIYRESRGPDHPDTLEAANNLGGVYRIMALRLDDASKKAELLDKAESCYMTALQGRLRLWGTNHPDLATSYSNLGLVYIGKEQFDNALKDFSKARDIIVKTLGENHLYYGQIANNEGNVYFAMGDFERALVSYKNAESIKNRYGNTAGVSAAKTFFNIGKTLLKLGEQDGAISYLERALAIQANLLTNEHRDTLDTRSALNEAKGSLSQAS